MERYYRAPCCFYLLNQCDKSQNECSYKHDDRLHLALNLHINNVLQLSSNNICVHYLIHNGRCSNNISCNKIHSLVLLQMIDDNISLYYRRHRHRRRFFNIRWVNEPQNTEAVEIIINAAELLIQPERQIIVNKEWETVINDENLEDYINDIDKSEKKECVVCYVKRRLICFPELIKGCECKSQLLCLYCIKELKKTNNQEYLNYETEENIIKCPMCRKDIDDIILLK